VGHGAAVKLSIVCCSPHQLDECCLVMEIHEFQSSPSDAHAPVRGCLVGELVSCITKGDKACRLCLL
jgi:hypothetical protein